MARQATAAGTSSSHRPAGRRESFTLIEVVLAIAIIAIGVTAILGLLPGLVRQAGAAADTQTALRLTDAVHLTLAARGQNGFDALAVSVPVMSIDPENGLELVAAKDGTQLRWLDPAESPPVDQYFLLTVRRFPDGPLAYAPSGACLALNVLVAWPYRPLGPAGWLPPTAPDARQTVNFNVVLNR